MSSDNTREIYRAHISSIERHTYFLLTAAGAGIALAVNQTHSAVMAWTQLPLACAVLCWAGSFLSGCRHVNFGNAILQHNLDLHMVESDRHPIIRQEPWRKEEGKQVLHERLEDSSKKMDQYSSLQFKLLVTGGVFYVTWHIFEMYVRTLPLPQ